MYQIIKKRKIWFSFSSAVVALSILAIGMWGLNFGIDFTGGSLLEVEFATDRPAVNDVQLALEKLELGSLIVQPVAESGMNLRFQDISEEKHQLTLDKLNEMVTASEDVEEGVLKVTELRYDSVGPAIGEELKSKSVTAMIVVLFAIVIYIAWAFRKVSEPVASWKYGLTAIVALFHDVLITVGAFAFLGHFFGAEVNSAFIAAILTVLGYSVNDTIVVFDRVRENLISSNDDFDGIVNLSVNQTIRRSINTSMTTLLVLVAIVIFGGSSIRDFVMALSIGVLVGTYSSIFLASPVLVVWEKMKNK